MTLTLPETVTVCLVPTTLGCPQFWPVQFIVQQPSIPFVENLVLGQVLQYLLRNLTIRKTFLIGRKWLLQEQNILGVSLVVKRTKNGKMPSKKPAPTENNHSSP